MTNDGSMRVVSTSPSGTEICYALGIEPVAVSHACDYPPEVEDLPAIDTSRIDGGSSAERHGQVRAADADGHIYNVDAQVLRDVEPDLILSQEVCGVCAVDTTLVDAVLQDVDRDPAVVGLHASRLEDLFSSIEDVGEATGREAAAEELVAKLRERFASIEERATETDHRPRTAVMEWMDPIHLGANWVPELVEIAGGEYDLVAPGESSDEHEWSTIREYDPEVLLVAPCSYSAERTVEQIDELRDRPGWDELTAVREGRVYALDGSSYLNRWTPRLVDATERLASCLHPDLFGQPPADVLPIEQGVSA